MKRCAERGPSVAHRYDSPEHTLDVYLRFGCRALHAILRDAEGKVLRSEAAYFDPAVKAFIEVTKKTLPKDRAIKKLR